jgi:DNA segregation ATPase FtsK/SpoIIIE-like protein
MLTPHGNLRQIVLGVTVDKQTGQVRTVTAPIWQLVHIANAGATDSGKSNMARSIAYQVATARNTQIVMVDLKRTTFKPFSYSDKLIYPIITTVEEFGAVIGELLGEVQRRLQLFERDITIETIHDYNLKAEEPLPYLVAFIDEISNIFRDKATQEAFFNLISMSRAAGLYFVCAGQSWSHRIMQTIIRQQFRIGLHFATNDAASSRMILNDPRATEIELQGRAFASLPFGLEKDVVEIQTPYLALETVVQTLPQTIDGLPAMPEIEPSAEERADQEFVQLVSQGMSRREAALQAYEREYAGSIVTRGKKALGEL